jgi:hypothetical protein
VFIGHFGVGFGLKRSAPELSLGTLFLASQFIDLIWPTLLLFGVERVAIVPGITRVTPLDFTHYPISHSLLAVAGWGLLFGLVYFVIRRYAAGAWICGLALVSHWLLDLLTHRPDLPLAPGGVKVGLGLWNSLPATLVVELLVFGIGVWLYLRCTRALNRKGTIGLWALLGFLVLVHLANMFGPPPPSVTAIAWSGQGQWLIVLLGYWVDRHRQAV